jgi:Amidohydrolase
MRGPVFLTALLGAFAWSLSGLALAQSRLPIFDAHIHYSEPAWAEYPPAKIMEILDRAGVVRGLASSSPDDGSLALRRQDPSRIIPFLRPYRGGVGSGNWTEDPNLATYLKERLARGGYAGLGEVHLSVAAVNRPATKQIVALAVEHDLYLHVHSDAATVDALFALEPRLKILWAHAGMSEPAETVDRMLARYEKLWTEVSFRAGDIGGSNGVAPAWRAVLTRHRDRILVGSDTWITPRWASYENVIGEHRRWLAALPRELAEQLAWRNAVRMFGSGGRPEFAD